MNSLRLSNFAFKIRQYIRSNTYYLFYIFKNHILHNIIVYINLNCRLKTELFDLDRCSVFFC